MATIEQEIIELKAEIAEYKVKLYAATTEAGEDRYANLIIAKEGRLTVLLQQQLQQQQGEFVPVTSTSLL